jgi:arsenical pump membrane protein
MPQLVLLAVGVTSMYARPARVPIWFGAAACTALALAVGWIGWRTAGDALQPLTEPLLFLLFAVPLAVLLDRAGLFEALAARIEGGPRLVGWLWLLAAAVTIVFNLDAAVVLLTPLYIRVAVRHHYPPAMLAFQPALLACLASGALPVSNLTNLVVAEQLDLTVVDFLRHLLLPTVAACAVGWIAYRRAFRVRVERPPLTVDIDDGALRRGLPIVAFVLVGFTAGGQIGIPPWVVAVIATAWAARLSRPQERLPWSALPVHAIVLTVALAVLVGGAVPHLHLAALPDGNGAAGRLRALAYGALASCASNNLPAVLAGGPALPRADHVWPLLVGANIGPTMILSGALSGLLWRDTCARLGVHVSARRFTAVGVRVGLPALLAAAALVVW